MQGSTGFEGPEGRTGPRGETGTQGPTGAEGATGRTGPVGAAGPRGETGVQGEPGVQGATGRTGPVGAAGPRGETGVQGEPGVQGATGRTGPVGAAGPRGETGTQGPTGPTGREGTTGPRGQTGAQGPTGVGGPQGPTGMLGETLAYSITLLTGGRLKTNDEDTRLDADGLWLKSAGSATYRPQASLKFHTGSWANKLTTAHLSSFYNDATATEYVNLIAPRLTGRGSSIAIEAYADPTKNAGISLTANNEDAFRYADIMLHAGPTGTSAQVQADTIRTVGAVLDLTTSRFATGAPATGTTRLFTRSTGTTPRQQLVAKFKSGPTYILADENTGNLPFLLWVGRFSQGGEDTPTTTTAYNSLGVSLSWTRVSAGNYEATTGLTLDPERAICTPTTHVRLNGGDVAVQMSVYVNNNKLYVDTYEIETFVHIDAEMNNVPIQLYYFP